MKTAKEKALFITQYRSGYLAGGLIINYATWNAIMKKVARVQSVFLSLEAISRLTQLLYYYSAIFNL